MLLQANMLIGHQKGGKGEAQTPIERLFDKKRLLFHLCVCNMERHFGIMYSNHKRAPPLRTEKETHWGCQGLSTDMCRGEAPSQKGFCSQVGIVNW